MKKYFSLLALLTVFLPQFLSAEPDDKKSCNGADTYECSRLVMSYFAGFGAFPKDEERALQLFETAKGGAREGCEAGNYTLCLIERNLVLHPLVNLPIKDDDIALALAHSKGVTEAGCSAGVSLACEIRAGLFADEATRFFLIQQASKKGKSTEGLVFEWVRDENEFKAKMVNAARAEAEILRPECQSGNARSCGQLGLLIANRELAASGPYEKIDLLITGCGAKDRTEFTCDALEFSVGSLGFSQQNREQEKLIRTKALQDFAIQCRAGIGSLCSVMAKLATDRSNRNDWNHLACQAEEAGACSAIGVSFYSKYRRSKSDADLGDSVLNFRRGCELGDGYSCHMLEALGQS